MGKQKNLFFKYSILNIDNMMEITKNFEYINKIANNVRGINQRCFQYFFDELKPPEKALKPDLWLLVADGRSECSLMTPGNEMAYSIDRIRVRNVKDVGMPGPTISTAAPELERDYNNINVVIASGGGESSGPLSIAKEIAEYKKNDKGGRWKIFLTTSKPNSSIAKVVKENDGIILKLRGARKKSKEFLKTGIMRDQFELGNCFLFHSIGEMIYENAEAERFPELVEERFPTIGEMIDEQVESGFYDILLDDLEKHCNAFCGGKGGGYFVSKMNAIRINHVKRLTGDYAFLIEDTNVPKPIPGDPLIITSNSGGRDDVYVGGAKKEAAFVVKLAEKYKKKKARIHSVLGSENSPVEKLSDNAALLKNEHKPGAPNPFYLHATYVQSPLPGMLAKRLSDLGYSVTSEILEWWHSL